MHKLTNIGAAVDVFRSEAHELLQGIGEALLRLERASNEDERSLIATETYRNAHNIKGAAALLEMGRVAELIHKVEDVIGGLRIGLQKSLAVSRFEVVVLEPGRDDAAYERPVGPRRGRRRGAAHGRRHPGGHPSAAWSERLRRLVKRAMRLVVRRHRRLSRGFMACRWRW